MAIDLGFRMHAERTPNPNSVKWVVSRDVATGVPSANFTSPPTPEERVTTFAQLVLDGDYDGMELMMAERLKGVITRETAQKIQQELLADGAPVRWSEPLRQAMVGEYTPYHVPVEFERGKISIRVVLDAGGLVAGLSRAPHP